MALAWEDRPLILCFLYPVKDHVERDPSQRTQGTDGGVRRGRLETVLFVLVAAATVPPQRDPGRPSMTRDALVTP